jgi:hypothetical protein
MIFTYGINLVKFQGAYIGLGGHVTPEYKNYVYNTKDKGIYYCVPPTFDANDFREILFLSSELKIDSFDIPLLKMSVDKLSYEEKDIHYILEKAYHYGTKNDIVGLNFLILKLDEVIKTIELVSENGELVVDDGYVKTLNYEICRKYEI